VAKTPIEGRFPSDIVIRTRHFPLGSLSTLPAPAVLRFAPSSLLSFAMITSSSGGWLELAPSASRPLQPVEHSRRPLDPGDDTRRVELCAAFPAAHRQGDHLGPAAGGRPRRR